MSFYKTQVHLSQFEFHPWEGNEPLIELGMVNGEYYYFIPESFPLPTSDTYTLESVTLTSELLEAFKDNTDRKDINPTYQFLSSQVI